MRLNAKRKVFQIFFLIYGGLDGGLWSQSAAETFSDWLTMPHIWEGLGLGFGRGEIRTVRHATNLSKLLLQTLQTTGVYRLV